MTGLVGRRRVAAAAAAASRDEDGASTAAPRSPSFETLTHLRSWFSSLRPDG